MKDSLLQKRIHRLITGILQEVFRTLRTRQMDTFDITEGLRLPFLRRSKNLRGKRRMFNLIRQGGARCKFYGVGMMGSLSIELRWMKRKEKKPEYSFFFFK